MGKKLDALLGRRFKSNKFKATTNLAVSRLAVLRNQKQARCGIARSDVVQLLNLGHHERALLRVEQVIKEQNMLDVFAMIEGYFHLLIERVNLVEQEKLCPEELKEAVSSLIYASTRCGEFPELQELRELFTSRFGKEFAARAVELRNNCGVNTKIIQKLSTKMPSLENRLKVLKEIAAENNISLQIEEEDSQTIEGKKEVEKKDQNIPEVSSMSGNSKHGAHVPELHPEGCSDATDVRRKYKDVADAAQAAFESAAYAAAAARAAVELSRSESNNTDYPSNLISQAGSVKSNLGGNEGNTSKDLMDHNDGELFHKIYPVENDSSETEEEEINIDKVNDPRKSNSGIKFKGSESTSSSDSADNVQKDLKMPVNRAQPRTGIDFDESDDEILEKSRYNLSAMHLDSEKSSMTKYDMQEGRRNKSNKLSTDNFPFRSPPGSKKEIELDKSKEHFAYGFRTDRGENANEEKRPISMRTRRTFHR